MKLPRQQRFEIIFYSVFFGVIGIAIGYFIGAVVAVARVQEALAASGQ